MNQKIIDAIASRDDLLITVCQTENGVVQSVLIDFSFDGEGTKKMRAQILQQLGLDDRSIEYLKSTSPEDRKKLVLESKLAYHKREMTRLVDELTKE